MCHLLYVSQADQIKYFSGKLYHVSSLTRKELFLLLSFFIFFCLPLFLALPYPFLFSYLTPLYPFPLSHL